MKLRRRVLLPTAVIGLLLAASVAVQVLVAEPWRQRYRLSDRLRLELLGVTTAGASPPSGISWWEPMANQFPGEKQGPVRNPLHFPAQEALTCWFRLTPPANEKELNLGEWAITDEHGCSFGTNSTQSVINAGPNGDPSELGWVSYGFPIYSRRSGVIQLSAFDSSHSRRRLQLTVPNPTPGPHPIWSPEPFPIRRQSPLLDVALLETEHGIGRRPRSAIHFVAKDRRPPGQLWRPINVLVTDATGNRVEEHIPADGAQWPLSDTEAMRSDGPDWISFPSLCRRESAWDLEITFSALFSPPPPFFTSPPPPADSQQPIYVPGRSIVCRFTWPYRESAAFEPVSVILYEKTEKPSGIRPEFRTREGQRVLARYSNLLPVPQGYTRSTMYEFRIPAPGKVSDSQLVLREYPTYTASFRVKP